MIFRGVEKFAFLKFHVKFDLSDQVLVLNQVIWLGKANFKDRFLNYQYKFNNLRAPKIMFLRAEQLTVIFASQRFANKN